jgi:dUTP pyrophosphatase
VLEVPVVRLDPDLPLPGYARVGDAGMDLLAREDVVLPPGGGRALVATGVAVAIPAGHAGFIQPRSGLALSHGVTCLNTPGLIDSGYRGELKVLLINTDPITPFEVRRGEHVVLEVVEDFDHLGDSIRGEGGFGHTGR